MQGGILGIQAKEETNDTQPTNKKPAIMGEAKRGERPKYNPCNATSQSEETRRGARRQQRTERERTHTH